MSTERFLSVDPTTGEVVDERPAATPAEIDAAIGRVADRFRETRAMAVSDRAAALRQLAGALQAARDHLAGIAVEEIGKPVVQARAEVDKCALACTYAADRAEEWLAPETVATEANWSGIRWDPLGPILAIMPWNFPFWQVFRFGASALAAGNTILLKHAPNAPRCAEALERVFTDAGLGGSLVNVYAPVAAVDGILGDPRIGGVTLTGSSRAGRSVAALAGKHLKPSVLELGGSDAFLVLRDADLDAAAEVGAWARMQNNGQSCIAAKRFVVDRAVAEPFLERLRARFTAVVPSDPRLETTVLGPMARRDLRDALHGQIGASVRRGARIVLGGEVPEREAVQSGGAGRGALPPEGFWFPPTIVDVGAAGDAGRALPLWAEETFGPAAAVWVADDESAAIRLASHDQYALGTTIFSRDLDRAARIAGELRVGAVFVNALLRSDPRLPFGGQGASGWGRELGLVGMRAFTVPKTVWVGA
jgi:succinate-semialdehyde dehydrogenase/glutarate-semialdehyde dehydrogenase